MCIYISNKWVLISETIEILKSFKIIILRLSFNNECFKLFTIKIYKEKLNFRFLVCYSNDGWYHISKH